MRCVAGVGLVVLVGCNQIFGLTPARTWDASIDVPPDTPHVVLTWQLATSQPSGAPQPMLSYPPLAAGLSPQIRIATLGGAFEHADYLSSPGTEGWILIPRSYLGTTWRLEYTLPGGVPHEVQWAPEDKLGHLTVPMVGRLERDPVPGGSGYTLTPSNYAGTYSFPRVFTTGLWTDGAVTAAFTGPTLSTVDYDFSGATPLSGPSGRPDPARGDRAALVDFATDAGGGTPCSRVAIASAAVDPTLQSGMHTTQMVTWDTRRQVVSAPAVDTGFIDRLTADPLRGTFSATQSVLLYGAVPSTDFPGLTGAAPTLSQIALPIPVMQTLLQCRYSRSPLPDTANPAPLDDFPRVLHVQLVATRQALGANLTSGLETVIASSAAAGFKIAFPAPLATKLTLTTPTGVIDLSGPSDQIPIGPSAALTFAFTPETGTDLRSDYHDIVLHKIIAGTLTTERIFTVTAPRVQIDGALLLPGTDYVLEIRSYKGHVMAPRGDFVPVDYPYGAAIVFSRTFKTS